MKIEFPCESCQATLRLDAIHAGRTARCPACGNISLVPDAPRDPIGAWEESDSRVVPSGYQIPESPANSGRYQPEQNPYVAESPGGPTFDRSGNPGKTDGYWTTALVCGIVSLVFHFFFCGCGSLLAPFVTLAGFSALVFARGNRLVPAVLLAISALITLGQVGLIAFLPFL